MSFYLVFSLGCIEFVDFMFLLLDFDKDSNVLFKIKLKKIKIANFNLFNCLDLSWKVVGFFFFLFSKE